MTGPWMLALFAAGLAVGLALGWIWMRMPETEEEEEYQDMHDEPEDMRESWPLERITPERYLVRFRKGPYAELAERIVRH